MTPALHDIEHEIGNLFSALEDMEPAEVEERMPSLLAYADMLAAGIEVPGTYLEASKSVLVR